MEIGKPESEPFIELLPMEQPVEMPVVEPVIVPDEELVPA